MDIPRHATCRHTTLLILMILQVVSTLEKQVFDFFGHLWAPVIGNFLHIFMAITGICGVWKLNSILVVTYATWNLLWLAWNTFTMCLYLEVGTLNRNRERHILTLDTDGSSWWMDHGIGCQVMNSSTGDTVLVSQGGSSTSEAHVVGCRMQYYYIEVIHAAVQCLFALSGLVASLICIHFIKKDRRNLTITSYNPHNQFLRFTFPFQYLNRKFHGTHPHTRGSAQHSAVTGNFDFQLPSLPHIAFPHSPDHPVTPRHHQNSRIIDPMLGTNLKTSTVLKTPSRQIQALKNSFSNLFMINHYVCSTFFSYPSSKRARLGAQSYCSDETISQDDGIEYMPIGVRRSENNLQKPGFGCSKVDVANDDVDDDDIWILQTEL